MKTLVTSMLLVLALCSCGGDVRPDNPGELQTGGEVQPPPGCRALRERGGSC